MDNKMYLKVLVRTHHSHTWVRYFINIHKMGLQPKNVLITGANRGLGLELVKQFLRLPSPPKTLLATCRSPENAKVSIQYIY